MESNRITHGVIFRHIFLSFKKHVYIQLMKKNYNLIFRTDLKGALNQALVLILTVSSHSKKKCYSHKYFDAQYVLSNWRL